MKNASYIEAMRALMREDSVTVNDETLSKGEAFALFGAATVLGAAITIDRSPLTEAEFFDIARANRREGTVTFDDGRVHVRPFPSKPRRKREKLERVA